MAADSPLLGFDQSIVINAAPARVLGAFFDSAALSVWWQTIGSITTPRPLGIYAVEWEPTTEVDDLLGRLGGVFYGIIAEYRPGRELFVADAYWLPPDGEPIGPMAFQVDCTVEGQSCRLRVRQGGFEESPRWERYYRIIGGGLTQSMEALKAHLEQSTVKR